MIRVVAPFIFLATSAIRSDRLPLLFIISPRYLYEGTGLLPVLLHWVLGYVFFLSLSLSLCIWQRQIGYGICLRHGLLRRVFPVVFVGRGGSGIHRPSITRNPRCSSVVFLLRGFFAGVLWLFRPWGLLTLLLIVLLLALCCPRCWFSLLVHSWFVSWQLGWGLSFLSFSDFCPGLHSSVGHIRLRPAMLCHRPFVQPGRLCMLCVPFLVFLGWFVWRQ